jgi:hypothetical protein
LQAERSRLATEGRWRCGQVAIESEFDVLRLRRKAEKTERGCAEQRIDGAFHRSLLQGISKAIFLLRHAVWPRDMRLVQAAKNPPSTGKITPLT